MVLIEENLKEIRENIRKAAIRSGRKPEDITLVAVTKTISVDRIQEAIELDVNVLGENRVQELLEKYPKLHAQWHLIGHLQSNKVKYIIDKVDLIHSVDSLRLAQEIDRQAKKYKKVMPVLVEVNVAGEDTKHGVALGEAEGLVAALAELPHLQVKGLMTVAPFVENPEENRVWFRKMRQLYVDILQKIHNNIDMQYLSMGMSNDYVVAIEEGSNMVRIGTGIFGKR